MVIRYRHKSNKHTHTALYPSLGVTLATFILISVLFAGCSSTKKNSTATTIAVWHPLSPAPTPTTKQQFPAIAKTLHTLSPRVELVTFQRHDFNSDGKEDVLLIYQDGRYAGAAGRGLIVPVDESQPLQFLGGAGAIELFNDAWLGWRLADLAGNGHPLLLTFGRMQDGSKLLNAFQVDRHYAFRFQIRSTGEIRWQNIPQATVVGRWQVTPALQQETVVRWQDGEGWHTEQKVTLVASAKDNSPDAVAWRFWQGIATRKEEAVRPYVTRIELAHPYLERQGVQIWRLLPKNNNGKTAVYWVDLRWSGTEMPCWEQTATLTLQKRSGTWLVTDLIGGNQRCSRQMPPPLDQ